MTRDQALDHIGIDRPHPMRNDSLRILEHCADRRYDEAAEHLLRLAHQFRDHWDRNREEWQFFAGQLSTAIISTAGAQAELLFRESCAKVVRMKRRLSYDEKRLEMH